MRLWSLRSKRTRIRKPGIPAAAARVAAFPWLKIHLPVGGEPVQTICERERSKAYMNWPGRSIEPGRDKASLVDEELRGSAQPADAPGQAAGPAAEAAGTTATPAAPAAPAAATPAAATPAAAAAAAPRHLLKTGVGAFLVKKVECREADVGYLLFAEDEPLVGRSVRGQRLIRCGQRGCGCAPNERKTQSGPQRRHGGGFVHTLPCRSLLHTWHSRILHTSSVRIQGDKF